ncbi:thiamine pyrophosphokinase [Bombiscardovia apis]|uniref:Thiamine diphosphokinase n=1 Tax=Bombiscardovia apis TaxID=2932182 RepID=A0ABN6SFQ0_9BIFI|nr:thiamine diphosphokinase [Bombiscardovia apis]BDR54840.1 thiamine pyrophosphokinase [Bombiscardovia apis]
MDEGRAADKTCLIFGAGHYYDESTPLPAHDFLIAADGGADHARQAGLLPDITVGDFDSITAAPAIDGSHIALPAEKDDTDMMAALKLGWEHGYRRFHIYGGLGGRIDHSIANVATLCLLAQSGGVGVLHGEGTAVSAICKGRLSFPAWDCTAGTMFSAFSASDCARGVSEQGFKYELDHASMDMVMSEGSGVSNEFISNQPAQVSVEQGTLIVTYPLCAPEPIWHSQQPAVPSLGHLDEHVSTHLRAARTTPSSSEQ